MTSIAFFADALTSETIAGLGGPDNGPISLDAVSTGASPMLSTVIFDGMINLSWTDDAYILQETSDLNGDWEDSSMPFEETADAGGKITTTVHVNPASDAVKFYRLKLVP